MVRQSQHLRSRGEIFCVWRGRHSFYHWHKRLREQLPIKFALVDTHRAPTVVAAVEVMLTTGERARIVPGIDAATLRLALSVLREPR